MSVFVQDHYPDDFAHCYGCGRLNASGYQIKTAWQGDEQATALFRAFKPAACINAR